MEKWKKIFDRILVVFFNVFLLLITLWITIFVVTSSKSFYLRQFEKNDVVSESGYSMEQLEIISQQIIDYLMGKEESMQVVFDEMDVFSNQALHHMRDVKDLYDGGMTIGIIVLILEIIILIYFIFNWKGINKLLLKYSVITIACILLIIMAIGIYVIIDFYSAFDLFHRIIFPDPQKYEDAFFGSISNYPEHPYINNYMLILILSDELFFSVAFIIITLVVLVECLWFAFLLFNQKMFKKQIQ